MAVVLLEWVFTSIFLILVVLALRAALGRQVSAKLRYALWAVVLVRLLVPVQLFTSPIAGTWVVTEKRAEQNVYAPPAAPEVPDDVLSLGGQDGQAAALSNFPQAPNPPAVPNPPEPPALNNLPGWTGYLGWAWLAGSAAVAFVLLLSNLRFAWRLRRERIPLETADCPLRVYAAVGLPSPCLFGIVRPAVYVTPEAAADPDMLRHVLAHEYTHYKHGDHIWSLLRCAALAAHWWDPLVWASARLSQRDAELACDEGALKRLGEVERAAYGGTLLALVTAKPRPVDLLRCATTMAGDKKSLKERISRIACAPKRVVWAVVVAVLVTALACVCAFGQGSPVEPSDDVDEFTPTYTMNGDRNVLIEGLDGAYVEWSRGTNGGALYLAGDMAYFCPKLTGETVEGGAYWEDVEKSTLHVCLNVDDNRIIDGTVGGFVIDFTVDLNSNTFLRREFASELGDRTIKLTDQEMLDMARVLAKLMTAAADYYNNQTAGDEENLLSHFAVDNLDDVPEDVLYFVGKAVQERYNEYLGYLETSNLRDAGIKFDDWRVDSLSGPWFGTACGMNLQVLRMNYSFHTTTPEAAENLIVAANEFVEENWLRPTYPNSNYVIFLVNDAGKLGYLTSVMINDCGPDDSPEIFYEKVARELEQQGLTDTAALTDVDLNRNGVPETLRVVDINDGSGQRLEVWEGDRLLWSEEGYYAHAGYNALFLYRDGNGQDYLLRYNPYMGQGWCTYRYQLFTLSENGEEQQAQGRDLEFDVNFHPLMHKSFDPETIAAFMDEVNGLLAHSVQLINTDGDLLPTFEKEGRLYDSLWWLDSWEPVFVRDESKPLLDNLRDFQTAMEAAMEAEERGDS